LGPIGHQIIHAAQFPIVGIMETDSDLVHPDVLGLWREEMKEKTHDRGNQYTGGKLNNVKPAKIKRYNITLEKATEHGGNSFANIKRTNASHQ
jgi:hypothetical protein